MKPLFAPKLTLFPHPELTLADGILDVSDDLGVKRLFEAYSFGIFPWPYEDLPIIWYCPEERGILDFKDFHISSSLKKMMRKCTWTCTFDHAFTDVMEACAAQVRHGQRGTWITKKMLRAYLDFHGAGYAHSLEVWDGKELVGGLYGVYAGGVFCGESMFHLRPNASKFALVKLVGFLQSQGLQWMDIQMVTPVLEAFGGRYIKRREFLGRFEDSRRAAKSINFSKV